MRLGMHEAKWDIWNGTRTWSQAQGMTQHTGMESSTSHDTAHRAWGQAQAMTQHTGHGVKHKARHSTQYMELSVRHEAAHNT